MTSLTAVVTDEARRRIYGMLVTGNAFCVKYFSTGSGGHDPNDQNIAQTPDAKLTALPYKSFGPKKIKNSQIVGSFNNTFTLELSITEAVGSLSNIGLIAEVTSAFGKGADPIGTTFLFAIANTPLRKKLDTESIVFTITVDNIFHQQKAFTGQAPSQRVS